MSTEIVIERHRKPLLSSEKVLPAKWEFAPSLRAMSPVVKPAILYIIDTLLSFLSTQPALSTKSRAGTSCFPKYATHFGESQRATPPPHCYGEQDEERTSP